MRIKSTIYLLSGLLFALSFTQAQQIRVACIGNSLTEARFTPNPATDSWPAKLQGLLGGGYAVTNFGYHSSTLLDTLGRSYRDPGYNPRFTPSIADPYDVVIILLGTNDTYGTYHPRYPKFIDDYKSLIEIYRNVSGSDPKIIVSYPPRMYDTSDANKYLINEIIPMIYKVAIQTNSTIANFYGTLVETLHYLPDGIHPNAAGAIYMARVAEIAILKALDEPPATPTNFTATGGSGQVNLAWNPNSEPDLATYILYKGTVAGGMMNYLASPSVATSYVDNAVVNGTTYYYQISAKDNAGNVSARTAQVNATPIAPDTTPPATPTNFTATGVNGQVNLAWNPNSEPDLASYNLFKGTVAGGMMNYLASPGVSATSYVDNAVVNGTTYYYQISAKDNVGNESARTAQVNATPIAPDTTPPAIPTNFTATGVNGQVNLAWNPNSEPDLASYNLFKGTVAGGMMNYLASPGVSATSYVDNAVVNGTTYYYQISAKDNVGNESTRTAQVNATPIAPDTTPPATPTNFTATGANGQVNLAWNPNSEPDLAQYNLFKGTVAGGTMNYLASPGVSAISYVDNAVVNGTTYYYQISAKDNVGNESARTSQVNATPTTGQTDFTPPATPTNFTATGVNGQVNLAWNANSEPDLAQYNIYKGTILNGWMDYLTPVSKDSTSYTDNTVFNDTTYYYKISAVDNVGNESTRTSQVNVTPTTGQTDFTPPATPTSFTATGLNGQVNLAWNANSEPDLAQYNIYKGTILNGWMDYLTPVSKDSTSFTDNTVFNDTTYYYKISAVDNVGNESTRTSQIEATPIAPDTTPPPAPTNLVAIVEEKIVNLSWGEISVTDLNYYNIYRSTFEGFSPTLDNRILTIDKFIPNCSDSLGLTPYTIYYYKISAVDNAGNESAYSNEASVVTLSIKDHFNIPLKFSLKQNYPNPFNPSTNIQFSIPQNVIVKITIYDILGNRIRELINQPLTSGGYSLIWNATNDSGQLVVDGIYFYKIQAGNFLQTKKMVLLK